DRTAGRKRDGRGAGRYGLAGPGPADQCRLRRGRRHAHPAPGPGAAASRGRGLARVDVVCLDKTGTLTDGTIAFDSLIRPDDQAPAGAALGALADDENRNGTPAAVGQAFPPPEGWPRQAAVPFSSARKWSAASFAGQGTWVLGAPEMVLPGGRRVQVLARA